MKPPFKPDIKDYRNNLEICNYPFEEVINVLIFLTQSEKNININNDDYEMGYTYQKWIEDF